MAKIKSVEKKDLVALTQRISDIAKACQITDVDNLEYWSCGVVEVCNFTGSLREIFNLNIDSPVLKHWNIDEYCSLFESTIFLSRHEPFCSIYPNFPHRITLEDFGRLEIIELLL